MHTLLKRWLAYLLIPAGLVLLFFPLNTHRPARINKDFVFLEVSETLVAATTPAARLALPADASMESALRQLEELQQKLSGEYSNIATTINPYGYPTIHPQDLTPYPVGVPGFHAGQILPDRSSIGG